MKNLYISKSKILGAGRGVFADKNFKKGELVESCPIIEIPKGDTSVLSESILVTYFLYHGKNKEKTVLMLGFGSIYNHSKTPNIFYKIKAKDKVVDFVALKNIKKDEELTFNYSVHATKKRPLWFK